MAEDGFSRDRGRFEVNFTIRKLLQLDILREAQVIAGNNGLDNEIKGITIIEAPDIAKYISGGEVLLTSLYPFSVCTPEEYGSYVTQLCEKGISAMILKVGRNIKSVDELKLFLLSELEKFNIPVIEIPLGIAYKDITYPVMERLFNEEVSKLKYFKETHDRFMSLSLSPPFSGGGFKKILNSLSDLIGNPVALFDKDFSCIVTTNKNINKLSFSNKPKNVELNSYSKYSFIKSKFIYDELEGEQRRQIIVPLNKPIFNINMYLVITELNARIDQLDYIAIENAVTAILLEFTKHRTLLEHEKEFKNNVLEQILNGKIRSRDKLNLNANLLRLPINAKYCVLVFSISDEAIKKLPDYKVQAKYNTILHEAIAMHFDNIHVQNNSNNIVVLQEVDIKQDNDSYENQVREKISKVQYSVCGSRDGCGVGVGVGSFVDGMVNIPKSFKEANDSLFLLENTDGLAGVGNSRVVFFSGLGIFKMFTYFDDPAVLNDFVPEALKKLREYKKPQNSDLIATLKTYLKNSQNVAKTAQDMFIHHKTVNYRIKKITSITGIDFGDADQVLEVSMGLIILRLLDNYYKGSL